MSKVVISFPEGKVKATRLVKKRSEWQIERSIEADFQPNELKGFFERVLSELKSKRVTLLVPFQKIWLGLVEAANDAHLEPDDIFKEAGKASGLALAEVFFDWKWVGTGEKNNTWQCLGVEKDFLEVVLENLKSVSAQVELFLAEPFALVTQIKADKPALIESNGLRVAFFGKNVFGCEKISVKEKQKDCFVQDIESRWGVELEEVKTEGLQPTIGAASWQEGGSGLRVLSLMPKRAPSVPKTKPRSTQKTGSILGVCILILAVAGGVGWWLTRPVSDDDTDTTLIPTHAPEVTVNEPVSEPAERTASELAKDVTIRVLNGNGEAGVAARGVELLTKNGFTEVSAGNAGRYDYETTLVQYKPVLEESIGELVEVLSENYVVELDKILTTGAEYDVVVIIGKT